ncbi:MAG: acyl-CoA desaturase [Cyanobacteria bacterium QH_8_48_120]|nr:MAG: acyl-CoA desaturase [Cyanobacteria bacterium QH_1_48_107]PSO66137.1 MAG: acyl-CoA desaturase [Cyanobacteria bacterium QH_6_48_35]PSO77794.1 MAG: acyl-CoA desaturase [Cyanobacteria bacterium QH_8_48_120]
MSLQLDYPQPLQTPANSEVKPKITISSDRIKTIKRRFIFTLNLVSFSGCAIALWQLWDGKVGFLEVGLLLLMYALTAVGITVGFHRHFAHKTFETKPAIRIALAVLGSMAAHGPLVSWVATHLCHHQYSDLPGDPHSPHLGGDGIRGKLRGLCHSHMGWLLNGELPNSFIFAKDLLRDPIMSRINRLYPLWIFVGLAIPAILGGVITWTWIGVFQGFLWGGLVRLLLSFHATNSVNSIAHFYGKRLFNTREQSKNNIWLAIPTVGEGWHNNHHAFPNSARFGLKWWQIDLGYWVIQALEMFKLAWDVKVPTAGMIEAKKATEINSG